MIGGPGPGAGPRAAGRHTRMPLGAVRRPPVRLRLKPPVITDEPGECRVRVSRRRHCPRVAVALAPFIGPVCAKHRTDDALPFVPDVPGQLLMFRGPRKRG